MSDMLTHWAVFEDCRRLAATDDRIEPLFKELIESRRFAGRLGALTRGGNSFMSDLLRSVRERWADRRPEDNLPEKLGFILGCLTHQACDKAMKPLISKMAGSDWSSAHAAIWAGEPGAEERFAVHNEISAYYDTHVFREVYASGADEPFNREFLAGFGTDPQQALEEFVRTLFQRALLSSHTLKPALDDVEAWLDRIFDLRQQLYVDVSTYVRVFAHPDPEKVRRYAVTTEFYSERDPAIMAARRLHRGDGAPASIDRSDLSPERNNSGYSRALILGLAYLRAASALWRGESDKLHTPNWTASEESTNA